MNFCSYPTGSATDTIPTLSRSASVSTIQSLDTPTGGNKNELHDRESLKDAKKVGANKTGSGKRARNLSEDERRVKEKERRDANNQRERYNKRKKSFEFKTN